MNGVNGVNGVKNGVFRMFHTFIALSTLQPATHIHVLLVAFSQNTNVWSVLFGCFILLFEYLPPN